MELYSRAAMERAMKAQEVILRAISKQISWFQAAEILRMSPRQLRRLYQRYRRYGYDGLYDRRTGQPSPKRVRFAVVEQVLQLYQEKYSELNVRHFHEKLEAEHGIELSYTWVKLALQGSGLVKRERKRGVHRKRRPRRPLPGMLLHIDGSEHGWFQDDRWYDLLAVMDDANSEIYYAQLVEEESTRTVMAALREVIERQGRFCALYSDRASHFFVTPRAGGPVDPARLTQVGRALKELGIQMIPAYSPQARGRSERNFGTWQGRLPQELRLAGIRTVEEANRFLRESYLGEFNRRFMVPATQAGHAFVALVGQDLDRIFSVQQERVVAKDNTVQIGERAWQIERTSWRGTLAGCRVVIGEHLDGRVTIYYGPQVVGRYTAQGQALDAVPTQNKKRGGNAAPWKAWKTQKAEFSTLSTALGNPAQNAGFPHSHRADGGV